MIKFDIKHWITGEVKFTAEIDCAEDARPSLKLGLAVKWAIKSRADLSGANLSGADLSRANLSGADLIDGGQRSDGYRFVGWIKDKEGVLQIRAGCRDLAIDAARKHWTDTRGGTPLGDETAAILDHIETVARIRGLIKIADRVAA